MQLMSFLEKEAMINKLRFILLLVLFVFSASIYSQKSNYAYVDFKFEDHKTTEKKPHFNLNPNNQDILEINYNSLKKYYNNSNTSYIENGEIVFTDLYQKPFFIDMDKVNFTLQDKDSTISLDLAISPESVQKLFVLNERKYRSNFKGDDFLEAKINSYKNLKYLEDKQCYSKKYYQLWDWKSLNHPPVRKLKYSLDFYDKKRTKIDYDKINSPFFDADFHMVMDKITNSHLTFENKFKLLKNGNSYQKKLELIRNASSSVFISVMSYFKDSSSMKMTCELIKKAEEGVHVYLIVEKVWTKLLMKKGMKPLKNSKVVVIYADDLINAEKNRTALFHNKIWVFDGETAIIGGQNIIDSDNISSGYNHQSHDTDLLVEGAAVTDITNSYINLLKHYNYEKRSSSRQLAFMEDLQERNDKRFNLEIENKLRGKDIYKEKLLDKNTRLDGVCRYIIQGPVSNRYAVSKAYTFYFKNAQNSIDITSGKVKIDTENEKEINAYEGWSERMWNQIISSAESGVRVNLIYNGIDGGYGEFSNYLKRKVLTSNDNNFITKYYPRIAKHLDIKAAKRNYPILNYLQQTENIHAWMYFQYMHSKTFMIDRFVVSVGSFNLDNWSSDKSQESVLICMDKELAKEYEYYYTLDMVNSTPVLSKSN